MSCGPKIWILWFSSWVLKCLMKPFIILRYIRRSQKLPPIHNKLLLHSATNLARMIRTRQVTSEEVVQAYISRIRDINPLVNCMMDNRFEAALLDAKYVDRVLQMTNKTEKQIAKETPFLGVPLSVKGSIAVKGLNHSAGELRFQGRKAQEDAETVMLMRASGAIPLLVTSTPELCMMIETYNKIIGTTNNPYDLRRTPSGSSGGEAALLASAASVIGLGSDILGSLRIPAAFTGIFAHKPTPGVVSHSGHNPTSTDKDWSRFFTIGPMSRYAEDLAPMLNVLAKENADKLRLDEKINMDSIKIYYMEDDGGCALTDDVSRDIKESIQKAVQYMKSAHGTVVKKVDIKDLKYAHDLSVPIITQLEDIRSVHRIESHPKPWRTIFMELVKLCTCFSERTFPTICYAVVKKLSLSIPRRKLEKFKERNESLKKDIYEMLGNDGVFLYPTFIDCANFHLESYYKIFNISYTMIMNALEVPVTNCPMGMNERGLPIGIQIVAAPFEDRLSIAVANELQAAFGGWTEPPASERAA
ncbi:fatty-acid amide hydrolase 2 [Zootermopsis nevadensis]|uniref:Fatty-acid amide hydrolase 2 n=1 Tax=Zootermopsis nevadensis TaxID=136037 RepID=A0A067R9Z7_ZOONE|nr:fatty-acid amide hydrolase 2 [Zootermopsis nevadensis]XP_021927661.1 fatty-acid amide hydrolase 2 [Zootermopsis nevadensis]XP_021927662.1 fatty-acid amide hydrolase 2 [Zootermopsis nevadensis]KDR15404.1 Fatty-acid amide hydrolase 2 [Zootermopsis nevadensis]